MRIYFSGIGGTGINPLANLALDANMTVCGSDKAISKNTDQLKERGVNFSTDQSGNFLKKLHQERPFDWFVYTSSLPKDHPELIMAQELGLKVSKRDQFINFFIQKQQLKLIAVAGTHGKTSTTTMLIWLFKQLEISASHLVGSNLTFANAGHFNPSSQYFIYEADEYDRNFLNFNPEYSIITSIDWDHIDIYPTKADYEQAFAQFISQSKAVFLWPKDQRAVFNQAKLHLANEIDSEISLFGAHNRQNAQLVLNLADKLGFDKEKTLAAINSTRTAGRRFEKLRPNLISDYAHHPTEIAATLQMAQEYQTKLGFDKIVVIYEPHQIDRQKQFKDSYKTSFELADVVYWLPTYAARGTNQSLTTSQLGISFSKMIEADFDQKLQEIISDNLKQNNLVILMSAGKLDFWVRQRF